MTKLSQDRATKEESIIEVGISLCAVDRLLGGEESSSSKNADLNTGTIEDRPATAKVRTNNPHVFLHIKIWTLRIVDY